jgi:hypothetical protein
METSDGMSQKTSIANKSSFFANKLGVIANKFHLSQIKPRLSQITLTFWEVCGHEAVKTAPMSSLSVNYCRITAKITFLSAKNHHFFRERSTFINKIGFPSTP